MLDDRADRPESPPGTDSAGGARRAAEPRDGDWTDGALNTALRFVDNPLPMWVYDLETLRIVDVNDAALALYGYDRQELIGRSVTELRASSTEGLHFQFQSPNAALPVAVTRPHRRKDGSLIDVHILSHPLTYRDRAAVLAVAQDVTDLHRASDTAAAEPHPRDATEALIALSRELQEVRTPDQAHAALTAHALIVASAVHAALALVSRDGQSLTLVNTSGEPVAWPGTTLPTAGSRLGWVVRTGRALLWPHLRPQPSSPCLDDAVYNSLGPTAVIPVGPRDRVMGALIVARSAQDRSGSFTPAELQLLEDIADIAVSAIERTRLTRRLQQAYARTALALAEAIEKHGGEPGSRAARLSGLAAATAGALGCSVDEIQDLRWGARLYDIGMVAVPDEIAAKPDALTEPEWAVVRQHPVIADEVLQSVVQLQRAAALVRHHHERWDGSGYPDGLRGPEIPLGARILAVLEAYAAMSEPRPYRPARSRDRVLAELRRTAGTQFDPSVVNAFAAVVTETDAAIDAQAAGPPGGVSSRVPRPGLDDTLLVALRALPDGARQLVRRLDIQDVELEVEEHLTRVGQWTVQLAKAAGLGPDGQALLAQAAFLHDVGKLSLSRALLRKPGPLSAEERTFISEHVTRGVALLRALEIDEAVVAIVAAHHERWDGKGYPYGLAGDAIPLEARILAVADSFDAMTSPRVYHHARTFEEAVTELRREAGRQFDGRLVNLFVPLVFSDGRAGG